MMKRLDELTPAQMELAAPLVAALRANGVEPLCAYTPADSRIRRIWRQEKTRAFKRAEAAARRRGKA